MPKISLENTELHYLEAGAGPIVVLLHAFPLDARMWARQIESLAPSHRVIAPDFRGFGQSSAVDPFSIETLAEDIHALISGLADFPIVLAGLSMGGYVALAYARKYPRALRGLILMDTKAERDTPEALEGRAKMIQLAREKGSRAIGDAMQPKLLSPDTAKHKPHIVKQLRNMTDSCSPQVVEWALAAMRDRPDQTDLLSSIRVPTLVVAGEEDTVIPLEVCRGMQQKIPGAELATIQGAAHITAMEQPELVNAVMSKFLKSL